MQTEAQGDLEVRLPRLHSYEAYYYMTYVERIPLWEYIVARKGPAGDVAWVDRESSERAYTSEERYVIASETEFLAKANEYLEIILHKVGLSMDDAQGLNERLLTEQSFAGMIRQDFVHAINEANQQHGTGME